jgi:amino acid adenylation domain-containing protein
MKMVQDYREAPELSILNWNPSRLEGPELLHDLVNSRSEAPAIDFLEHGSKRRQFSYRTLHALSDALAEKITTLSETLENASQIVPVLLPQCPELYVVLLAILKAGKAFCPLNLDVPEDRLNFILKDISADFLITQPQHKDRIHAITGIRTLSVDHELFERSDYHPPRLPYVRTEDLAYVLYTSGSTGLPKAVSVTHRAVTQSLLAHDRHIPQFIRFLQFAAPTFDVSIFEIFFPWYRGCTLVGSSRTHMLENLPSTIQKLNADAAELTPTVIGNLLQGRKSVPGLRLLLTIGEMLTQHVIDEFGSSDSQQSILWAMYGPTEAAIHCTLQPKFHASCSVNMIGYPLDTVSTLIIDPSYTVSRVPFKILPIGEEGELVLGGYQLAEGYINRPDLTAASFINHPEYGCLYRTGDRAKINKDGTLECLGRVVAGQVKLRGQRVEIGEIEQSITQTKGCRAATVIIINDSLIAFCAAGSGNITRTDILQTCKRWLPNFMIPSDVHILPALPQLPSGKVDKKSLETQYLQTLRTKEKPAVETNDHVGTPILQILREVLGQDVFLDTHLGSVGLDSLRAIPTASKLRLQGYNIGAVDVLSADTVRELIAVCKQLPTSESDNRSEIHVNGTKKLHVPEIRDYDAEVAHVFPCTPLQEAMLTETTANPAAYCNWIEVELSVSYTYTEIHAALSTLVEANEILRSGFCPSPDYTGAFVQIVWKSLDESQIQEVTSFSRNFSMASNKSLLRPLAFQVMTGPGKPRFLLQIHHALYDGWSFDLLLHDLDKTIRGFKVKKRPQFREVVQYYSNDQRTMLFEDDKLYWADLLRDSVPTRLANYNGYYVSDTNLNTYSTHSTIDIQKLSRRARDLMINPQVFYQAAVGYILGQYLGTSDVMFGNITSGRTIPITGIEDVIGPCIASVPFRVDIRNLANVRDLLAETQRVNRESLRHSALPLRDIVRTAGIQPGQRLFDVLFVWQQSSSSETNSSLIAKPVDSADHLEFKLTLEFEPREDCVSLRVTYDPSTMPKRQIEYLSRQIDEVVSQFLTDIDCRITEIGKCFTTESRAIANPHPLHRSSNHGLSHAVEQWAVDCPDKEAVVMGHLINGSLKVKDTVTYTVLNARANQLARVLQGHGVAPDHLVGIVMEKSVDLYVSILAVLKLGAGYLPLVPDTPAERIKTILTEAEVAVCISQSTISIALRDQIPGVSVDIDLTDLSTHSSHNLDIEYNGSHIAYAVFTSGSTGTPKGVLVTQENLASNLDYLSTVYPTSPDSRMLQSCSQAFDVSVFEIFFSWHVGMCLCTATKEDLFHNFEAAINNLGITHLSLTPTVAALVDPKNVPKVEFLVTAGEALTEHVRREWAGRGLFQGKMKPLVGLFGI